MRRSGWRMEKVSFPRRVLLGTRERHHKLNYIVQFSSDVETIG